MLRRRWKCSFETLSGLCTSAKAPERLPESWQANGMAAPLASCMLTLLANQPHAVNRHQTLWCVSSQCRQQFNGGQKSLLGAFGAA